MNGRRMNGLLKHDWCYGLMAMVLLVCSSAMVKAQEGNRERDSIPSPEAVAGPFDKREIRLRDSFDVRLIAYPPGASYKWSTGWQTPVVFVKDPGWVWVDVSVDGVTRRDSIHVLAPFYCIVIPSVFSPNSEIYDCISPQINCTLEEYKLEIYSRWGNLMHQSTDPKECWDGTSKGQVLSDGTYFYVVHWKEPDGRPLRRQGNVTVIR
jgi:gliding motility-associated-like protein